MNVHFDSSMGLTSEDIEDIERVNECVARLIHLRLPKIEIFGRYRDSKLAWKVGVFRQSILYRIVALSQSLALSWNVQNMLGCNLSARALIETSALLLDFEHELMGAVKGADLGKIDSLVTNRHFATRDKEWLEKNPDAQAVNVLTLIDKLDKRTLENARRIYDILSESCHPNYLGHQAMFASLDTETGVTVFSDAKDLEGHRHAIVGSMLLIMVDENCLNRLELAIDQVADLQLDG